MLFRSYRGQLAALGGDELGAAVAAFERFEERLGRIMSFADLTFAGNQADPEIAKFFQTIQERVNAISTETLFFTLELNRIDDAAFAEKLKAPALARYAPWLRDLRIYRPHQLSDDLEKLLHEKHVAGRAAWTRLFDQTMADLRFPLDGRALTNAEAFHLLSDRSGAVRRAAAKSIGKVLGDHARLFALVTNTLAKDKEIEDKWRRYAQIGRAHV